MTSPAADPNRLAVTVDTTARLDKLLAAAAARPSTPPRVRRWLEALLRGRQTKADSAPVASDSKRGVGGQENCGRGGG
jgi:hypothetical protein